MRVAAAALSMLGALVSLYVPVAAYQNNLSTGFPTPPVFFVMGAVFALLGAAGGLLAWRGRKLGPGLLLTGTVGGLAAWPWLTAAIIYLLAAAVGIVSMRMAPRATDTTSRLTS